METIPHEAKLIVNSPSLFSNVLITCSSKRMRNFSVVIVHVSQLLGTGHRFPKKIVQAMKGANMRRMQ